LLLEWVGGSYLLLFHYVSKVKASFQIYKFEESLTVFGFGTIYFGGFAWVLLPKGGSSVSFKNRYLLRRATARRFGILFLAIIKIQEATDKRTKQQSLVLQNLVQILNDEIFIS